PDVQPNTWATDRPSPWSPPLAVPTPLWMPPLCSPASQLLWRCPTSRVRSSSATRPFRRSTLSGPRCERRPAERYQPLYDDVCQGADSARSWLLVADALQRAPFLRAEPPQALFARHQEQDAENQPGWLAHIL